MVLTFGNFKDIIGDWKSSGKPRFKKISTEHCFDFAIRRPSSQSGDLHSISSALYIIRLSDCPDIIRHDSKVTHHWQW